MACTEHTAIFSGQTSSRICPGWRKAGEKSQRLEAKRSASKTEGGTWRSEGPCSVVQCGSRPLARGGQHSCCRICLSTAAAGAKLFRIYRCLQERRQQPPRSQVQLWSSHVGPVGGMCLQQRIPNCSLLLCLAYWGTTSSLVGRGVLEGTAC